MNVAGQRGVRDCGEMCEVKSDSVSDYFCSFSSKVVSKKKPKQVSKRNSHKVAPFLNLNFLRESFWCLFNSWHCSQHNNQQSVMFKEDKMMGTEGQNHYVQTMVARKSNRSV